MQNRRYSLCLPPAVLCLFDAGLTLLGQPNEYWAGDYAGANEWNPVGYALLSIHPWAFAGGVVLYLAGLCAAVVYLHTSLAILLNFAGSFGHALGASLWLSNYGVAGWVLAVVCLAGASWVMSLSWVYAFDSEGSLAGGEVP